MLYILINYQYNLLDNLFTVEELTNSQDIIVTEKISYYKIYKLGNLIFGIFVIRGGSVFNYSETLFRFPFKSKTEYRGFINNKSLAMFMILKNGTELVYMIPHSIEIPNLTTGSFYFVI